MCVGVVCLFALVIDFILYLSVLLFVFLFKIVTRLHGVHKCLFEPCRMGGEELWHFSGKSQQGLCSEKLQAEGRNRKRSCVLVKKALMPILLAVWIDSELLTYSLMHIFFSCIQISTGMLPNPDIPQLRWECTSGVATCMRRGFLKGLPTPEE